MNGGSSGKRKSASVKQSASKENDLAAEDSVKSIRPIKTSRSLSFFEKLSKYVKDELSKPEDGASSVIIDSDFWILNQMGLKPSEIVKLGPERGKEVIRKFRGDLQKASESNSLSVTGLERVVFEDLLPSFIESQNEQNYKLLAGLSEPIPSPQTMQQPSTLPTLVVATDVVVVDEDAATSKQRYRMHKGYGIPHEEIDKMTKREASDKIELLLKVIN